MARCLWLLLVGAVSFASPAARAEDTYTIKLKRAAKGDVGAFIKEGSVELRMTGKDGETSIDTTQRTAEAFRYREEVLEKEAKQRPTRVRRDYEKAEVYTDNKTSILPYQGKSVIIGLKDGKYQFQLDGKPLSGNDAHCLAKEFREDSDEKGIEASMLPRKPVAVNEIWNVDVQHIAKEFGKEGKMDIDVAKATGTGKLERAYTKDGKQFGVLTFQLEFPVKALRNGPKQLTMQPGAKVIMNLTLDACIDGSSLFEVMKSKFQMTGVGSSPGSGGKELRVNLEIQGNGLESRQEAAK